MGTPAVTTRDMKEKDIIAIAEMIDRVLCNIDNNKVKKQVLARVNALCHQFVG